jgi:hypothetical protein
MAVVRVKIKNETNSGNRKGWSKLITGVDIAKTDGYAFQGNFLRDNTETDVEIGSVIVQKHPEGSVKHSWESGHCYTVGEDGQLHETGKAHNWFKDFLSFRDHVAKVHTQFLNEGSKLSIEKVVADIWEILEPLPVEDAKKVLEQLNQKLC